MCMEINTNAHTAQYIRCCPGKEFTIVAGVISNNHTAVLAGFCTIGIQQISAKTHCCLTYSVLVHAVGTGTHHTTQSARAKFKITVKAILDFFFIINGFKFLTSCLIKELVIQPLFISFLIAHNLFSLYSRFSSIFLWPIWHSSFLLLRLSPTLYFSSSTPFTQCPLHLPNFLSLIPLFFFIPTPSGVALSHTLLFPTHHHFLFFSPLSQEWGFCLLEEWLIGFVWLVWFVFFSSFLPTLLLFFYPIHPVYLQLSFTPHLNFLIHPNLSVLVLVKMLRNSTYKVGWKEWETNLPDHSSPMKCNHSNCPRYHNGYLQHHFFYCC